MEIIIKTQKELDNIPLDCKDTIYIEGGTQENPLILKVKYEHAFVVVRGSAQIIMRENSVVQRMWENSVVQDMWENSVVQDMRENSVVQRMWENSVVQDMRENSVVQDLYGEAMVSAYGNNKITAHGYNIIRTLQSNKKNLTLVMSKDCHLIVVPDFKPNFKDFAKRFPVEIKGKNAILYKAVHKINGGYFSDNDRGFEYKIGEVKKHENSSSKENSCAVGLHVAEKHWAVVYGSWDDMALLECEVPIKNIVVAKDCNGKCRTSQLKILREVPKEEW